MVVYKKTIKCKRCGKIEERFSNAQYCSECVDKKNREYKREWEKKNRLEGKDRRYKYDQSDRGKKNRILNAHKRRAKKRGIKHKVKFNEWYEKILKTDGYCPYCKKYVGIENLSLDHTIPISLAPDNFCYKLEDINPICKKCNLKKSKKIVLIKRRVVEELEKEIKKEMNKEETIKRLIL